MHRCTGRLALDDRVLIRSPTWVGAPRLLSSLADETGSSNLAVGGDLDHPKCLHQLNRDRHPPTIGYTERSAAHAVLFLIGFYLV